VIVIFIFDLLLVLCGFTVSLAGHFIRRRGHRLTRSHPRWSGEAHLGLLAIRLGHIAEIAGFFVMGAALVI
jgi:hypothetical protein